MIIYDFSPYKENTTGKDNDILLNVNTLSQYNRAVSFCRYHFGATFPGENIVSYSFDRFKKHFHGNSKLLLHCFYNTITGKYDMQITTKTIEKTYKTKYDFVGNLTDYANTL